MKISIVSIDLANMQSLVHVKIPAYLKKLPVTVHIANWRFSTLGFLFCVGFKER